MTKKHLWMSLAVVVAALTVIGVSIALLLVDWQMALAVFAVVTVLALARPGPVSSRNVLIVSEVQVVGYEKIQVTILIEVAKLCSRIFTGEVRQVRLQSTTEENVVNYTAVVDVANPDESPITTASAV